MIWWVNAFMFAQLLCYTWGQGNGSFRNLAISFVYMISSMVMSTTTTYSL